MGNYKYKVKHILCPNGLNDFIPGLHWCNISAPVHPHVILIEPLRTNLHYSSQLFFVPFKSFLQDQAVLLQEQQDNETKMKNDDKIALAFGQYIVDRPTSKKRLIKKV